MHEILNELRSLLFAIHPLAPWLALALIPWLTVYLVRKCFPGLWLWLESWGPKGVTASRVFLALPSVITTAAFAAIGAGHDPWTFVKAACAAAFAPLIHHALKASPLPYKGELGDPPSKPPPGAGLLFIVLMCLPGCGLMGIGGDPAKPPPVSKERADCYAKEHLAFHERVKSCSSPECTEGECLEAEAECIRLDANTTWKSAQEACPE